VVKIAEIIGGILKVPSIAALTLDFLNRNNGGKYSPITPIIHRKKYHNDNHSKELLYINSNVKSAAKINIPHSATTTKTQITNLKV
jgi:hypothetical protein